MIRRSNQLAFILIVIAIQSIFSSCTEVKKIAYFKDIPDSTKQSLIKDAPYTEPVIIPDDILSITITTIDPTTAAPVNQSVAPASFSTEGGTSTPISGLLVDKNGYVSFPILGAIKVAGLTTSAARDSIRKVAKKFFKDPDVQLRFSNFKISVLGEVAHPATFVVPNEKVSLLDALSTAGDLTIYGRRENVLLIREINGTKELVRFNLNSSDIFRSPYFYLRQNDVIYVEPNKSKAIQADAEQTRIITIAASVVTGLLLYLRLSK